MAEYIDRAKIGLNDFEIIMCDGDYREALKMLLQKIQDIPAADVQPVKNGKWIWDDEGFNCSECFFHAYDNSLEIMQGIWNHCPHCGTKMDGA